MTGQMRTTGQPSLLETVRRAVADRTPLADAEVERATVGDRLLMVELGDGDGACAAGVAHRPAGELDADPTGHPALDVGTWATDGEDVVRRAVGVAALNALSASLIEWAVGDPFEALSADASTIATVGLFGPAFRKFGAVDVRVIERRDVEPPEAPPDVTVSTYTPRAAHRAIEGADVLFVTGSTLLYGGTENYLEAARDVPSVVLIGATASFVPGPAFEAGATMLAGARVTDGAAIRRRIQSGDCATDLHGEGLEKVYATNDGSPAGLEFG